MTLPTRESGTIKLWWALVMVFLSTTAMAGFSFGYSNYTREQAIEAAAKNLQNMCGIISTLDDAYKDAPPTTPTGKRLALEMGNLRKSLGCK